MKAHPADILKSITEISGKGSKAAKAKIVKEHLDVPEFVKTVEYALNPWKQFYTTTIPGLYQLEAGKQRQKKAGYRDVFGEMEKGAEKKMPWKQQFETMFALLDDMTSRKLPPNSTKTHNAVLEWAQRAGEGAIHVFRLILLKDLRCGMQEASFNAIKEDWIPEFSIQLALKWTEKKVQYPCFVDPKFDGERCIVYVYPDKDAGSVAFMSRSGKEFMNLKYFSDDLLKLVASEGPTVLDCELISKHGFQSLQKVPTNFDPKFDASQLKLIVFDIIPTSAFDLRKYDDNQQARYKRLTDLFKGITSDKIEQVNTRIAKDRQDLDKIFEYWVDKGLEGVVIKQQDGLYEFKRSDSWIKLKPEETEDLKIVDMELGDANKRFAGKCGALIVERKRKDGEIVKIGVASGLTEYHHENISKVGDQILYKDQTGNLVDLMGKTIEVVYDCETDDGSLRFPRIKTRNTLIRLDK